MKIERHPQHAYNQNYQQPPILNRRGAQSYQLRLGLKNPLSQEISRILSTYQSGLHQLSNGQKINATQLQLLGGAKDKIKGAIVAQINDRQKAKRCPFEAPSGKRIVEYEIRIDGKPEDRKKVEASLYCLSSNSNVKTADLKAWERDGGGEVKANVAGVSPVDIGVRGFAKSKDEKSHEEIHSNATLLLEIKANRHFWQSMDTVEVAVDVWVEDIPEKKEVLSKEITSSVSGCTSLEGSISSSSGDQPAFKETVEKITKVSSEVKDSSAKGDIHSKSNIPKVVTEDQMARSVNVDSLREEIERINTEIGKLKEEKAAFFNEWRQSKKDKEDDDIVDELKDQYDKVKQDIQQLEETREKFGSQVQEILLGDKGKGKEKKK